MRKLSLVCAFAGFCLSLPAAAGADPISAFALFAGNVLTLGPQANVAGMIGANDSTAVTYGTVASGGAGGSTIGSIKTAGGVYLGGTTTVTGNVVASGLITLDNFSKINGNADSSVNSGSVALVLNNSSSKVVGTFTHKPGSTISLNGGATIAGNIGVNNTATPPTAYVPTSIQAATVFSSSANGADSRPVSPPGGNTANFATTTLLPGTYNDINLGANNTLNLSAGTYYFDTWSFDNNAKLVLNLGAGNIFLYFTGNVSLGSGFDVQGVTAADANRIYAETLGNWTLSNGAANTGKQSWIGTLFASGATSNIFFGSEATLAGQAWARNNLTTDQYFKQTNPVEITVFNSAVPEPSTLLLLGTGAIAMFRLRRKR